MINAFGKGMQIGSSLEQSRSDSKTIKARGMLLGLDSKISRNNADIAIAQAAENARLIRRESRSRLSDAKDKFARSGIALTGSPLVQLEDAARENEIAAQREIQAGEIQATSFINQANVQDFQKRMAEREAVMVRRQGTMSAIGGAVSVLGSASK